MTERLDVALVRRGLSPSRTAAARAIDAGLVRVDGEQAIRAALKVGESQSIELERVDRHVSRAARKLIAALDAAPDLDLGGRLCLDVGASTGGFTQVLLERGAARVIALDVGHAQLHPLIRSDPRVAPVEGENARFLTPARLEARVAETGRWAPIRAQDVSLVVADLSFISLGHVVPAVRGAVSPDADWILLVKPQFEVGRQGVREGIVADRRLAADAVERVLWMAWDEGLELRSLLPSPILGTHGNREYLARFASAERSPGRDPGQWSDEVRALVEGRGA